MQAATHANEMPGAMALHHLMPQLLATERKGLIQGEIIVVPTVNPIGQSQLVGNSHAGRYNLLSKAAHEVLADMSRVNELQTLTTCWICTATSMLPCTCSPRPATGPTAPFGAGRRPGRQGQPVCVGIAQSYNSLVD